ncbi:putative branched-subunit amino acid permease [Endozoicomonas sp. NE35]
MTLIQRYIKATPYVFGATIGFWLYPSQLGLYFVFVLLFLPLLKDLWERI